MRQITYAEALNEAMREELRKDPHLFIIGEDIGFRGGAFKVTKDLYLEFPDRIIDTPIAENAIAGAAYGAAITGVKAIAEFMYADFSLYGLDQIVNSAAKCRFMYGAQTTVPVVFRLPGGGGRQNAAQHSQSLEAVFANIPGLKIIMPATPEDAKGLLKSAINDNNPIVFIEHKALYFTKGYVPEYEYYTPIGKGMVRREGKDVTVVATQYNMLKSLEAAEILAKEGIDVEVIDPRTIVPLDEEIILESVRKTGRLVVSHEAPETYGVGGEICAMVTEKAFDYLNAPPIRACGKYLPIPYNRELEKHVIPQVEDIVASIRQIMSY
ncbi:MAG TPA: alpha-ketoacid dehydrogenase subunit beta [Clostridiaceae bacterium]|nr:alpha-ketoacid dehydrogenase subunit beta [Clostridiaceae bacterium]